MLKKRGREKTGKKPVGTEDAITGEASPQVQGLLKAGKLGAAKGAADHYFRQRPDQAYLRQHTRRVRDIALEIGRGEGADLEVIAYAATLHDITKGSEPHAQTGAAAAREILERLQIPAETVERVASAIETHYPVDGDFYADFSEYPIENRCLFDADWIDANMGAVGLYRFITYYTGQQGMTPQEVAVRLTAETRKYDDGEPSTWLQRRRRMLDRGILKTETGRRIAEKHYRYMRGFVGDIEEELGFADGGDATPGRFGLLGLIGLFVGQAGEPNAFRDVKLLDEHVTGLEAEAAGDANALRHLAKVKAFRDLMGEQLRMDEA